MKTKEQIKNEINDYLDMTSKHVFIVPNKINKWSKNNEHYYEYDYDNYKLFKIIKIDNKYYDLRNKEIDIDSYIKIWNNNAKNVIKNKLFLNKKMKSIKNTKYIKNMVDELIFKKV